MPEELAEFYPFMHGFGGFRDAIEVAEDLPAEGHAILLGGDIIGLDLARTLLDTGHKVTLIAGEQTFWPHEVSMSRRPAFIAALTRMGIRIIEGLERGGISAIEQGAVGFSPRRVLFRDGSSLHSDVIMPFFGITPALGFMLGSGADIERGLLVSPELRTSNENIWAAGDVCQIWTPAEKRYAFYYGWKNVRAMGELAAKNMTGASESWAPDQDESLILTEDGHIQSPFWEYR
jgi:NAD(P)H-nitrite reductase large subunit